MNLLRSYNFRLYPTTLQEESLGQMFATLRELYNAALQERRDAWKMNRKSITFYDQTNQLKHIREEREDLNKFSSQAAQQILRRVDKTFRSFFRRIKQGQKPGYPRFKSKARFTSVPFVFGNGISVRNNRLYIKGVGIIRIKWHINLDDVNIKQVVIKRSSSGKWYAIFQVELPETEIPTHQGTPIGIDVGIKNLVTTSDGEVIKPPRYLSQSAQKLRKQQRRLARRKRGSRGRERARIQVSKTYEKIANQRLDFSHKLSRQLADKHGLIAIEDLEITNMVSSKLSKSILDASWGQFFNHLSYKVESTGSELIKVNPRNTSQACSSCGNVVKKDLTIRIHECLECGLVMDRDINAAKNILNRALRRSVPTLT
jgi:putative transposase